MVQRERSGQPHRPHPFWSLSESELELILRMTLVSGSLKELAQSYKVSYPTIRVRVNAVIERLKAIIQEQSVDPMVELVQQLVERGEVSRSAAQAIIDTHRRGANLNHNHAVLSPPTDG
jgi:hypothetical protein